MKGSHKVTVNTWGKGGGVFVLNKGGRMCTVDVPLFCVKCMCVYAASYTCLSPMYSQTLSTQSSDLPSILDPSNSEEKI